MTRPLRLDHEGAVWHITSRGNARARVFQDARYRREFLEVLGLTIESAAWRLHAFVLMGNHYHLLLETPEKTLSKGMHLLNGVFTQRFNRRWKRVGHLFQGRFKSILVERESHLLELLRYVVLNPVRAGMVDRVEDWPWSSFRATAGIVSAPPWLEVRWTLAQFPPPPGARRRYRNFVRAGIGRPSPLEDVRGQIYLGDENFRKKIQARIDACATSQEHPEPQRRQIRPTLEAVLSATARHFSVHADELTKHKQTRPRLAVAWLAWTDAGLKLEEFAKALGIKRWAASHLTQVARRTLGTDSTFQCDVATIRSMLTKITLSQT